MNQIVFASRNSGKIKEVRAILGGKVEILSLDDIGFTAEIAETGSTFFQNALLKSKAVYDFCGLPTLSDDSGLCVRALNGAPGVHSARFSAIGTDKENNEKLLRVLNGIKDRRAAFKTCAVLFFGGKILSAEGTAEGVIIDAPRGTNGFGYDPLFYSDTLKKTFAECSDDEKNTVSHRAAALNALEKML